MTGIFTNFLTDVVNDALVTINSGLHSTLVDVLRIETLLESVTVISAEAIEALYWYTYTLVSVLVVLKFLWKGFSIWILWRDGDADSSPQDMVIGAIQGTIFIVAFPFLYDIMADVTIEFATGVLSALGLGLEATLGSGLLTTLTLGIFDMLLMLVFLALSFVMRVKLIGRGFELLIMRLGMPFACLGMLDSDYGMFKSYMQTFYRALFTTVIQVAMLSLSLLLMSGGNFILGFAAINTAFNAPLIMQQVLVATGRGGGLIQKFYTGSMAIRAIGMLKGG